MPPLLPLVVSPLLTWSPSVWHQFTRISPFIPDSHFRGRSDLPGHLFRLISCRIPIHGESIKCVWVAVGISVTRSPPQRSPRAALPHEALVLDEWRQSERWAKDGEHARSEEH